MSNGSEESYSNSWFNVMVKVSFSLALRQLFLAADFFRGDMLLLFIVERFKVDEEFCLRRLD